MTSAISTEINPPRPGTKQAKFITMLSRKNGTTIAQASKAFTWQPHTTRATMTGLKKRGYIIERVNRDNKDTIYIIRPQADA